MPAVAELKHSTPYARRPYMRNSGELSSCAASPEGTAIREREARVLRHWADRAGTLLHQDDDIATIMSAYRAADTAEIQRFIRDYKFLCPALLEAPTKIRETFGDVVLELDLFVDHDNDMETLFIVIKNDLDPEEAVAREQALISGWFVDRMPELHGKLSIAEEPL